MARLLGSWSTGSFKTSNLDNPGLHFLRSALFKLVVIYSVGCQHLKKPSTTLKWSRHVKIIAWISRTMRRTKNEETSRKAREDIEFLKEALQEFVRLADKGSKYYDEMIRGLTESIWQESLLAEVLEVWVIIKGIGRPSLDPLEIGKRGDLASLQSSTRDLSVTRKTS